MTRYLLDTNILSEVRRPAPSPSLLDWLGQRYRHELFIASLTIAELRKGMLEMPIGRKREALHAWFSGPLGPQTAFAGRTLPFDEKACLPWAELMAVNANTGDIAWRVPLGINEEMEAKGIHNTGAFGQGGPISTAGGLTFIAGTIDKRFRAFDSRTGKVLWETKMDTEGHTNPMTYLGHDGKQYVLIFSSGVNAFALEQ